MNCNCSKPETEPEMAAPPTAPPTATDSGRPTMGEDAASPVPATPVSPTNSTVTTPAAPWHGPCGFLESRRASLPSSPVRFEGAAELLAAPKVVEESDGDDSESGEHRSSSVTKTAGKRRRARVSVDEDESSTSSEDEAPPTTKRRGLGVVVLDRDEEEVMPVGEELVMTPSPLGNGGVRQVSNNSEGAEWSEGGSRGEIFWHESTNSSDGGINWSGSSDVCVLSMTCEM